MGWLAVTQIRSHIGRLAVQRVTLKGLGITKRGRTAYVQDTPSARGQIARVGHLVEWTEVSDAQRAEAIAKVKTASYEVVDTKAKAKAKKKAKPAKKKTAAKVKAAPEPEPEPAAEEPAEAADEGEASDDVDESKE